MAMRQKPPTFRVQPSLRPVYEDFQPKSKTTENPDAYILQIQIPGFVKDRVKITYVSNTRMLRVSGERPIENNNRWSRFNQTYAVPKDCEVEKIQGNIDQGVLTITMPKKLITQIPQEAAKASPEKALPAEPKPEKEKVMARDEDSRDKKMASPSIPSPVKGEKVEEEAEPKPFLKPVPRMQIEDEKAQRVQEEFEPKPTLKPAPGRKIYEITQKDPDEARQKIPPTSIPRKDADEMIGKSLEQIRQRITATSPPGKQQEEDEGKNIQRLMQKEGDKAAEPRKPTKKDVKEGIIKENDSKEKRQLGQTKTAEVSSAPKTPEKEKKAVKKEGTGDKGKKEDGIVETIEKGMKEVAASASQTVAKISEGTLNDEERRSLLNMGAAAMVIAALGAYIAYRLTASGKP